MMKFLKNVLVIVLFCASLGLLYVNYTSDSDRNFAVSSSSNINHIKISNNNASTILNLVNQEWFVNGEYPAHKKMIENLQIIISKIAAEYPLPNIYANSSLTGDSIKQKATLVQLYKNDKLKQSYHIYSVDSIGCIGLLENAKQAYVLHLPTYNINPFDYIDASPSFWLNNIVFSYKSSDIERVEVENIQHPEESFRIEQSKNGKLKIFDKNNISQNNIDSPMAKRYLSYFGTTTFDHYIEGSLQQKQAILNTPAAYILKIKTNNDTKECRIIPIPSSETDIYGKPLLYNRQYFYLSVNNNTDIALTPWLTFDILLKNLSDFID